MQSALAKEKIGDAALKAKTGKTWREWYAILDKAGARKMNHTEIAAHLYEKEKVPGWWCQMVAVGYEQARGLRQKHERPDGFEISASKTIAASLATIYRAWKDEKLRQRWLPKVTFSLTTDTPNKCLRMKWGEGSERVDVAFFPKGTGKGQITVQHRRLPTATAAEKMKTYWQKQLGGLKTLIENSASAGRKD